MREIQAALDSSPAVHVTGVFLQISKSFDKVWHIGILFKLQAYGADGENYLENRKQRFV